MQGLLEFIMPMFGLSTQQFEVAEMQGAWIFFGFTGLVMNQAITQAFAGSACLKSGL
jgi:hypothetical protein